nr:MAG: hypothetical protein [brine shrimp reovirus 1]
MGSSASTVTNVMNTYNFTGNNNGIRSGDQSVGTASASATTDVSPKTDLNYSTGINPSWWGSLINAGKYASRQIAGTIGNNSDLIQTFKHVGATALRVAMGDGDMRTKATKLVEGLLSTSTPQGSLTSKEQVPMTMIRDIAELHTKVVDKLEDAHDAFHTVALGSTGMRNIEVSTQPTPESIVALRERASPTERQNEKIIIETVGPKLGVVPVGTTSPPSDLAISTFDNARSKFGRLATVKKQSEAITEAQGNILFSILHNPAATLAQAGILKPFTLESSQFIGSLKQISVPFTAASYPNGHQFAPSNLITSDNSIFDSENPSISFKSIALSSYAYALPFLDVTREVRLILSGQLVITNQAYDPAQPIQLGFVYQRSDHKLYFNKAVFINTDVAIKPPTEPPTAGGGTRSTRSKRSAREDGNIELNGPTDVATDFARLAINDPSHRVTTAKLIAASRDTDDVTEILSKLAADSGIEEESFADGGGRRVRRDVTAVPGSTFSYSSQWQVAVNLSNCVPITPQEAFGAALKGWTSEKPFGAILVARYPSTITLSAAVQTPVLSVTVIRPPDEMRFIGSLYFGTVIELLGHVPDWYSTQDLHDPWRIYYEVIKPIINYAGRIALLHTESGGAAYNLTVAHVTKCRVDSGLPALNKFDMKEHIMGLMVGIATWLSDAGPVREYTSASRRELFMHICEKVMFQSLTHIRVFAQPVGLLTGAYLADCNKQNAIEVEMDKALLPK